MYDFVNDIVSISNVLKNIEDSITPASNEGSTSGYIADDLDDYAQTFGQFQNSYDSTYNDLKQDYELYTLSCLALDNKNVYGMFLSNVIFLDAKNVKLGQVSQRIKQLFETQACITETANPEDDDSVQVIREYLQTYVQEIISIYNSIKNMLQSFLDNMSTTTNSIITEMRIHAMKSIIFMKHDNICKTVDSAKIDGIKSISTSGTSTGGLVRHIMINNAYSKMSDIIDEETQTYTFFLDQTIDNTVTQFQNFEIDLQDFKTNIQNIIPCGGIELIDECIDVINSILTEIQDFKNQVPKSRR